MEEQRKYHEIDETTARAAKQAYSFFDYSENSATNTYKGHVDSFNKSIDDLIKKHPDNYNKNKEKIDRLKASYSKKLADAVNEKNRIDASVPSVMIAGPANFPVRKKQQQMNRLDNWYKTKSNLFEDDNYIYNKISGMLKNNTIYSNESDAVDQLNSKLQKLQKNQEEMKARNAYYRKHKTMKGYKGISDKEAAVLDKSIQSTYYKKPYASFQLQNNLGSINQVKSRIRNINAIKSSSKSDYPEIDGLEVIENKEQMRLQLKFDGKPDEQTRTLLKSKGFRWSPKNQCWQRQLTGNARTATKHVLQKLSNEQAPKQKSSSGDWFSDVQAKTKKKTTKKSTAKNTTIPFSIDEEGEEFEFFSPYRKTRSGKVIYAKNYGYKAFRMVGQPRKKK